MQQQQHNGCPTTTPSSSSSSSLASEQSGGSGGGGSSSLAAGGGAGASGAGSIYEGFPWFLSNHSALEAWRQTVEGAMAAATVAATGGGGGGKGSAVAFPTGANLGEEASPSQLSTEVTVCVYVCIGADIFSPSEIYFTMLVNQLLGRFF
jgi:hypothetical protein